MLIVLGSVTAVSVALVVVLAVRADRLRTQVERSKIDEAWYRLEIERLRGSQYALAESNVNLLRAYHRAIRRGRQPYRGPG